jgi:hypothetical protein
MEKTIAQQLNVTKFPFIIKDDKGNLIYFENSKGNWAKTEYDDKGNVTYHEDDDGYIMDKRPKSIPEYTMEELVIKLGHNFKIKK